MPGLVPVFLKNFRITGAATQTDLTIPLAWLLVFAIQVYGESLYQIMKPSSAVSSIVRVGSMCANLYCASHDAFARKCVVHTGGEHSKDWP
eukprot:scaffold49668_cov21-Tisochrysis_lutea.AAC.1